MSEMLKSPAPKELKRLLTTELPFYLPWVIMVTLFTIDMLCHPDFGVANMKTRSHFIEILGPWIKYIGNFGYSVLIGAGAGITTYLLERKNGYHPTVLPPTTKIAVAAGLDVNPIIEGFPQNNEKFGDNLFGSIGFLMGFFLVKETCARIDSHFTRRDNPQQSQPAR